MADPYTGDPRRRPGHRERGPKRYSYTVHEVARVLGCSVRWVYQLRQRGALNLDSLESVVTVAAERRARTRGAVQGRLNRDPAGRAGSIPARSTKAAERRERRKQ